MIVALAMSRPTAIATLARTAIDAARASNVSEARIDVVLAGLELDRAQLAEHDARIAVSDLLRLWELLADESGDEFFGLHAGEKIVSARTIHLVGYAARNSSTIGECYRHTVRFAALTNESSEIAIRIEQARASVICGPMPGYPVWPRVYAEMAMAAYFSTGQRWADVAIRPHLVCFQHAKPADVSEYERLFDCPLQFGAPKNRLVLPASALDLPFKVVDPDLLSYFEEKAAELLADASSTSIEQRVRAEISRTLAEGPTLTDVAKRLALSSRTLQRRLADEGLQFATIVDDVRRIEALRLMSARTAEIAVVAFRIGYRDLDAFRTAFQRWTGKTPRAYRQGS
jgi:AraC-like DNA-binding protein